MHRYGQASILVQWRERRIARFPPGVDRGIWLITSCGLSARPRCWPSRPAHSADGNCSGMAAARAGCCTSLLYALAVREGAASRLDIFDLGRLAKFEMRRAGRGDDLTMPDDLQPTAMQEHYARGIGTGTARSTEPGSLSSTHQRDHPAALPPRPAIVADIGGGPGRYALWLGQLGYQILHRDLMPLHVEQLRQAASGNSQIHTDMGDARQLDLASRTWRRVLCSVPCTTWSTAKIGCRPWPRYGAPGPPRWPRIRCGDFPLVSPDGTASSGCVFTSRSREPRLSYQRLNELAVTPLRPGSFCGYLHLGPASCEPSLAASGLQVLDLVSVEGPAYLLDDLRHALPMMKIVA